MFPNHLLFQFNVFPISISYLLFFWPWASESWWGQAFQSVLPLWEHCQNQNASQQAGSCPHSDGRWVSGWIGCALLEGLIVNHLLPFSFSTQSCALSIVAAIHLLVIVIVMGFRHMLMFCVQLNNLLGPQTACSPSYSCNGPWYRTL